MIEMELRVKYRMSGVCRCIGEVGSRSVTILCQAVPYIECWSAAARLLRLWVRIPPWSWMSVCCESCVLSGRGICDLLITRPEESCRLWCVVLCNLETS